MTLMELLVALALTAFLLLGLIQIVSAAGAATRLQDEQGHIQDASRYAIDILAAAVRQAGYSPEPWNDAYEIAGLAEGTVDAVSSSSDRLAVRSWSDLNCFDNRNPVTDAEGNPRFFLRESTFDLNGSRNLTHHCRYGPSPSELIVQIRRQGLIPGVEAFQLLFAEDGDGDGTVERWVNAGQWGDPRRILGVKIGLLLASDKAVDGGAIEEFSVLDARVKRPADGKLRRLVQFTTSIRGRTG